jgi:hypothetical protein
MEEASLRISYDQDDEWFGEIHAEVKSGYFSGNGSAWFDKGNLKSTFVTALRLCPLNPKNLPTIENGFGEDKKRGKAAQCHLRIAISPYNSRGSLLVRVDLATKVWVTEDSDMLQTVTARFRTDYPSLERFACELEEVLDGKRGVATLLSSDVGL